MTWTVLGNTEADRAARLAELAPPYRYQGYYWVRPTVGAQEDYLKPLSAWWILLFGLSIVARYEPAEWAKALSINESDLAAALEALLEDATVVIPQLVLEALEGKPFLIKQS